MNNSIQQMQLRAHQAILDDRIEVAIEMYSRFIATDNDTIDNQDMSTILAARAGCFMLANKFEDALIDSERAISLDERNISGHFQKAKALLSLHKVTEAQDAIRIGRSIGNDDGRFNELERTLSESWFTLGHKYRKSITAVALSLIVGLATNWIGDFLGWKQGIIVMVLCLILSFIHLRRCGLFVVHVIHVLWGKCTVLFTDNDSTTGQDARESETNRF